MPIQKFRTLDEMHEMRKSLWSDKIDAAYVDRMRKLWRRSALLAGPRNFPKGVIKYRSTEDAQADRDRWLTEHVQRLRQQRQKHTDV